MKTGTLYGIGIGPGDPDLMTLKGADILSRCRNVFVPKARTAAESVALRIAGRHLGPDAEVHVRAIDATGQNGWVGDVARRAAAPRENE